MEQSTQQPGVVPMVDASTAHLNDQDVSMMRRFPDWLRRQGFPRVISHEYGFTIFLTGDTEGQQRELEAALELGFGDGLLELIKFGHQVGAYVLNFDRDAGILPQFIAPNAA